MILYKSILWWRSRANTAMWNSVFGLEPWSDLGVSFVSRHICAPIRTPFVHALRPKRRPGRLAATITLAEATEARRGARSQACWLGFVAFVFLPISSHRALLASSESEKRRAHKKCASRPCRLQAPALPRPDTSEKGRRVHQSTTPPGLCGPHLPTISQAVVRVPWAAEGSLLRPQIHSGCQRR